MSKYDLFISWSGPYAEEIDKTIKGTLDQLRKPNIKNKIALKTFISSEDINVGKKWHLELDSALSSSKYGLFLVTQDIIYSEWFAHEAGALGVRAKELMIYLVDAPAVILPEPLRAYQHEKLNSKNLGVLVKRMAELVGASLPDEKLLRSLYSKINKIKNLNSWRSPTPEKNRWNKREKPILISAQGNSPYDLEQLFGLVRERLVLVAQNHRFMTDSEGDPKFWPLVEDLLKKKANIDIIGMHPDVHPPKIGLSQDDKPPSALDVWAYYMKANKLSEHVIECWDVLKKWSDRYQMLVKKYGANFGRLRIFGAYFTPVTISAIDPHLDEALLIVSPRMSQNAKTTRPQFILKKEECSSSFEYFWETIDNGFDNSGWEQKFILKDKKETKNLAKKRTQQKRSLKKDNQ